ncbi:hypothetical protein EDD86DRAFT_186844 [Gorgonomyces haynaldii]|nr:hypothetical protein EDD86DRAFT_186844 [Gorgonomyces haynaldii]
MVFYFESDRVDPPALIYMGKDKFENEDLIKYGWNEDVWFHVDKLSSAHVYLRMNPGQNWESLPEELLQDLAQLTKANSIQGNKTDNLTIIYTPWENLKKTQGMETGQVTFHKGAKVKKVHVKTRVNEIVNRLNKTKYEKQPDLEAERIEHQRQLRKVEKEAIKQAKQKEMEEIERKRREKQEWDYGKVIKEEAMYSNKGLSGSVQDLEDDFM